MKKELSRYDVNRKIKCCLVSHKVNLAEVAFSFSGRTAWFQGKLSKNHGSEFTSEEIEYLCKDISSLPSIRFLNFELEDWSITAGMGSFSIARKAVASSTSSFNTKPLIIRTPEEIEDVLEDHALAREQG